MGIVFFAWAGTILVSVLYTTLFGLLFFSCYLLYGADVASPVLTSKQDDEKRSRPPKSCLAVIPSPVEPLAARSRSTRSAEYEAKQAKSDRQTRHLPTPVRQTQKPATENSSLSASRPAVSSPLASCLPVTIPQVTSLRARALSRRALSASASTAPRLPQHESLVPGYNKLQHRQNGLFKPAQLHDGLASPLEPVPASIPKRQSPVPTPEVPAAPASTAKPHSPVSTPVAEKVLKSILKKRSPIPTQEPATVTTSVAMSTMTMPTPEHSATDPAPSVKSKTVRFGLLTPPPEQPEPAHKSTSRSKQVKTGLLTPSPDFPCRKRNMDSDFDMPNGQKRQTFTSRKDRPIDERTRAKEHIEPLKLDHVPVIILPNWFAFGPNHRKKQFGNWSSPQKPRAPRYPARGLAREPKMMALFPEGLDPLEPVRYVDEDSTDEEDFSSLVENFSQLKIRRRRGEPMDLDAFVMHYCPGSKDVDQVGMAPQPNSHAWPSEAMAIDEKERTKKAEFFRPAVLQIPREALDSQMEIEA